MQTVHAARIEQANGNTRAGVIEERVLPDHKASLREKDAELQVCQVPPMHAAETLPTFMYSYKLTDTLLHADVCTKAICLYSCF